jgi:hypothetical protein
MVPWLSSGTGPGSLAVNGYIYRRLGKSHFEPDLELPEGHTLRENWEEFYLPRIVKICNRLKTTPLEGRGSAGPSRFI